MQTKVYITIRLTGRYSFFSGYDVVNRLNTITGSNVLSHCFLLTNDVSLFCGCIDVARFLQNLQGMGAPADDSNAVGDPDPEVTPSGERESAEHMETEESQLDDDEVE